MGPLVEELDAMSRRSVRPEKRVSTEFKAENNRLSVTETIKYCPRHGRVDLKLGIMADCSICKALASGETPHKRRKFT